MPIQYKVIAAQNGVVNTLNGPMNIQQVLDVFGQYDGELVSVTTINPTELLFFFKYLSGSPPPGF